MTSPTVHLCNGFLTSKSASLQKVIKTNLTNLSWMCVYRHVYCATPISLCPYSRTAVRSDACWLITLGVSQGVSLRDFQLASGCPVEKVTLWEVVLYLTSRELFKLTSVSQKTKFFALTGNRTSDCIAPRAYSRHGFNGRFI